MSIARIARPDIRALKPYASARSLFPPARVSLDANENPWTPTGDDGLGLNRYPDPQPRELLEILSDLYQVSADCLLVTRGSDEAIDLLVRSFCQAEKDAIAHCPPCFGMYAIAGRIQGVSVVDVPLAGENFDLPVAELERVTARTKVLFLCSPNNPTGNVYPRDQVTGICKALDGRALVVVDEAYAEFSTESLAGEIGNIPNLAILRTLSKAWSLAGVRCGSLLAAPDVIELVRRILPPYPLSTPSVAAALTALSPQGQADKRAHVIQLIATREQMAESLSAHPEVQRVWPSAGNFLLLRMKRAREFFEYAARNGVLLRDFSLQPALSDCLRVTVGSEQQMSALISLLDAWRSDP
jgi:histidinol-phosphate aminotransferase